MSLLERIFGVQNSSQFDQNAAQEVENQMSPGLTGEYDLALREKAGMHKPPTPPEYMGFEGEYDIHGLAKRVAVTFDQNPLISDIETLDISQDGKTVIIKGSVPNQFILNQMIEAASKIDGTLVVDTSQVTISA